MVRAALALWLMLAALTAGCQSCERLETPAAFRCARDAGASQCLGGWRCGLDGFCFDPSVARVAPCESDADCAATWRCGPPLASAPAPGLACRARDVGQTFTCASDVDCEGGWRCGLAGVCLDTAAEGLGRVQPTGALLVERVSSKLDGAGLAAVAVSDPFYADWSCPDTLVLRDVVATGGVGGQVQRLLLPGGFPAGLQPACDAGVVVNHLRRKADLERFELGAEVLALAQSDGTTFAILPQSRVCTIPEVGQVRCEALGAGSSFTRLRASQGLVVAFGAAAYRLRDPRTGAWSPPLDIEGPGGSAVTLNEVTPLWLRAQTSPTLSVLAASTSAGLLQVDIDDFGRVADGGWPSALDWSPTTETGCSFGPSGFETLGLSYDPALEHLLLRYRLNQNQTEGAMVLARVEDAGLPCPGLGFPPAAGGYNLVLISGECPFGTLSSATAGTNSSGEVYETLELRCASPDGGHGVFHADQTRGAGIGWPAALLAEPSLAPHVKVSTSNPLRAASVSRAGAVWLEHGATRQAVVLDRPALGFWGLPDGGLSVLVAETRDVAGTTLPPGAARLVGGLFEEEPGVGLVWSDTTDFRIEALSAQRPDWALGSARFQPTLEQQVVVLLTTLGARPVGATTPLEAFTAPFQLAPQRTPDGGTLALVSAYDALLAADVTQALASPYDPGFTAIGDLPRLTVRLVPLSRSPITALLALPPQPDGQGRLRLAEGYLLSSGRLFRFEGDNEVVWRTFELDAPFGEPFALLEQEGRARVGYRSGELFSLPSRVALAAPVPSGEPVLDLHVHCGTALAVTRGDLFRLELLGTEVQGRWAQVPLPVPPGVGAGLFSRGPDVLVVGNDGTTQAVSGWSCP